MIRIGFIFLTCFLFSSGLYANEFKFNYKNLNSLASTICENMRPKLTKRSIFVSSFNVDRETYGPAKGQTKFHITGTCNAQFSQKTKKMLHSGEEFSLDIDLKNLSQVSGKIGINELKLNFKGKRLKTVYIDELITGTSTSINLEGSQWASSNILFLTNKSKAIRLKVNRRIIASEMGSQLSFKKNAKLYNHWSYQAFSCAGKKSISLEKCETLSHSLSDLN